ncbi:MAG: hypothetical protein JWQ43_365 [Glaciihabitans sp.]|nr:hypothetical protein [Glaciihabitans sp.]
MDTSTRANGLDWAVASAAIVIGVVVSFSGASYGLTAQTGVGAGFFPLVAGILMTLAGALWIGQLTLALRRARVEAALTAELNLQFPQEVAGSAVLSLMEDQGDDEPDAEMPDRAGWVRIATILGSLVAAAVLLPLLGYTIVVTLQLAITLFFVSRRKLWISAAVALGAALGSRVVFEVWLGVVLPTSSLGFLAGLGL